MVNPETKRYALGCYSRKWGSDGKHETGKIEKTYEKDLFVLATDNSSLAFGNPRLFEDPYTEDVWVATIQGAIGLIKEQNCGIVRQTFGDILYGEMYFSKDAVWAAGNTNPVCICSIAKERDGKTLRKSPASISMNT